MRAGTRCLTTYIAGARWRGSAATAYASLCRPSPRQFQTSRPWANHGASLGKALEESNMRQAQKSLALALDHGESVSREVIRKLLALLKNSKSTRDLDYLDNLVMAMPSRAGMPALHYEYHALMYAYGLHHQPERARMLLDRMRRDNLQPTISTYNTLMEGYMRANDHDGALRLLDEIAAQGLTPDADTYNALIHVLANGQQTHRVYALYERMLEQGVKPDNDTYTTLLGLATKDKNTVVGDKILTVLLASDAVVEAATAKAALEYQAVTSEQLAPLLELYHALPSSTLDTASYNIVLDACFKHDDLDSVVNIDKAMRKAGCEPDTDTYAVLLDVQRKSGNVDGSQMLLDDIRKNNIPPNKRILTAAANLARTASLETVRNALHLVQQSNTPAHPILLDTQAYNALLAGLAHHGAWEEAQRLYDAVFRDHRVNADLATYNQLMLAYVKGCQLDDAMDIYYDLREHHRSPKPNARQSIKLDTTFYTTLISAMTEVSTPQTLTEPIHGFVVDDLPDHHTHDSDADTPVSLLTALTLFNDMRQLQIQPNTQVYTAMVQAAAQYRDAYVLQQIHRLIRMDLFYDPDTSVYNTLMDAYHRVGDGHMVMQLWDMLAMASDPGSIIDQATISIALDSCRDHGFGYKAASIWQMAKQAGFQLNTSNYNAYLACLCRPAKDRKGWDEAWRVLNEEMRTSQGIGPNDSRPQVDENTVNTLLQSARTLGFSQEEMAPILDYCRVHFPSMAVLEA